MGCYSTLARNGGWGKVQKIVDGDELNAVRHGRDSQLYRGIFVLVHEMHYVGGLTWTWVHARINYKMVFMCGVLFPPIPGYSLPGT